MGIKRLWYDLLPYAERVILGSATTGTPQAITIQNLVIDGPSLVHFVYNKLLAYRYTNLLTHKTTFLPPTYDEINHGVSHLLGDIQNHGISIQKIFFDGGLPESKREVRLGRMEKARQQLDWVRRLYLDFPPVAPSFTGGTDLEKALWGQHTMSSKSIILPPPPFMIASAIETLHKLSSEWRERVTVMPGEADMYCALAARGSADPVAVLTDDMDLAVHDLGPHGRVAPLHSLEKKTQKSSPIGLPLFSLTALSINPTSVASSMHVPSLLAFGFERSLQSSISSAVIRKRAADPSRLEQLESEYATFLEEFRPSTTHSANNQLDLDDVDPRTAELIITVNDAPHVFLTPVLEDPQRDSSWSYGAEIRQLAYSILLFTASPRSDSTTAVTEYVRKGQRIAPTTITVLKGVDVISQTSELEALLSMYLSTADGYPPSNDSTSLLSWYILAIHLLQQDKVKVDKSPPPLNQIVRLLGLSQTALPARTSWDDIHLLANIHAVLYSLRMLCQITGYALKRMSLRKDRVSPPCLGFSEQLSDAREELSAAEEEFSDVGEGLSEIGEELSEITKNLHQSLSRMPPIADLFLDIPHLREKLSGVTTEIRNSTLLRLSSVLEPGPGSATGVEEPLNEKEHQDDNMDHENGQWISAKQKRTLKYKARREVREEMRREKANAPRHSTNIFGLLSDEAD